MSCLMKQTGDIIRQQVLAVQALHNSKVNFHYCVFRLFEMGFSEQLQEIIKRLPDSR